MGLTFDYDNSDRIITVKVFHENGSWETLKVTEEEFNELLLTGAYKIPTSFYKGGVGFRIERGMPLSELVGGFVALQKK